MRIRPRKPIIKRMKYVTQSLISDALDVLSSRQMYFVVRRFGSEVTMSLGLLYEHWMTRRWSWIRLVGFLVLAGLSAWLVPALGGHVTITTTTIKP